MRVRTATTDDLDDVLQLLDAAALETDRERTRESIAAGLTVVAVADGRVLGAAVCVRAGRGVRIDAIAVRNRRQAQGIGTALVEEVCDRHGRVVAEFDQRVRPFYESLNFDIAEIESGRFRGVKRV